MRFNHRLLLILLCAVFGIFLLHRHFSTSQQNNKGPKETWRQTSTDETSDRKFDDCYYDSTCVDPQILFRLHAETAKLTPFGCLNDIRLFSAGKLSQGMNLALINDTTGEVEAEVSFDVSKSDEKLITWLRNVPAASILIAVSFGDIAEKVSADARQGFSRFGASQVPSTFGFEPILHFKFKPPVSITNWRAGSAYAFIGQDGLKTNVVEQIFPLSSDISTAFERCTELPLGQLAPQSHRQLSAAVVHRVDEVMLAKVVGEEESKKSIVEFGERLQFCGTSHRCPLNTFSLWAHSESGQNGFPKMCINDVMIFDENLNGAGRGINVAIVEPKTARVLQAVNFDTYEKDSAPLEKFMESIPPKSIVIILSYDEASTMLSDMAKQIFYELGSSMSKQIKFRSSWFFVGHKGMASFTPFEEMHIPSGNSWPKALDERHCIPKDLNVWGGRPTRIDGKSIVQNVPRRHFCSKHDQHDDFCREAVLDDPLTPKVLRNESRAGDPIFNVPILVVAGLYPASTRKALETLFQQEGINTQMIMVAYYADYPENAEIAGLFHAKAFPLPMNLSYSELERSAIIHVFGMFSTSPAVLVIQEDVYLSPDWLHFFSQTFSTLLSGSVDIVQAFNPLGYVGVGQREEVVNRVDYQPPMYSFMLSRAFFEREIKDNSGCCQNSLWNLKGCKALVPEVSRIIVETPFTEDARIDKLFIRERIASQRDAILASDFKTKDSYDTSIRNLFSNAIRIDFKQSKSDCFSISANKAFSNNSIGDQARPRIIYYEPPLFNSIYECFNLTTVENVQFGVYNGATRLYIGTSEIFLVNKESPAF